MFDDYITYQIIDNLTGPNYNSYRTLQRIVSKFNQAKIVKFMNVCGGALVAKTITQMINIPQEQGVLYISTNSVGNSC